MRTDLQCIKVAIKLAKQAEMTDELILQGIRRFDPNEILEDCPCCEVDGIDPCQDCAFYKDKPLINCFSYKTNRYYQFEDAENAPAFLAIFQLAWMIRKSKVKV